MITTFAMMLLCYGVCLFATWLTITKAVSALQTGEIEWYEGDRHSQNNWRIFHRDRDAYRFWEGTLWCAFGGSAFFGMTLCLIVNLPGIIWKLVI